MLIDASLLYADGRINIYAHPTHLLAEYREYIGDYNVRAWREKRFVEVEDIHALPLRGILRLTKEFALEVKTEILNKGGNSAITNRSDRS